MLCDAAGPVFERTLRFAEMRAGIGDALLFLHSRAANRIAARLHARFEWLQFYGEQTKLQACDVCEACDASSGYSIAGADEKLQLADRRTVASIEESPLRVVTRRYASYSLQVPDKQTVANLNAQPEFCVAVDGDRPSLQLNPEAPECVSTHNEYAEAMSGWGNEQRLGEERQKDTEWKPFVDLGMEQERCSSVTCCCTLLPAVTWGWSRTAARA